MFLTKAQPRLQGRTAREAFLIGLVSECEGAALLRPVHQQVLELLGIPRPELLEMLRRLRDAGLVWFKLKRRGIWILLREGGR